MSRRRYKSEAELAEILRKFEDASISRDDWKHSEHMVVAMFYLQELDLASAIAKIRAGILNLLEKGFEIDLAAEMPYHETITVFWMLVVSDHLQKTAMTSMLDRANELATLYQTDHPLKYYSRELLFSDRARSEYVAPDLIGDNAFIPDPNEDPIIPFAA